MLDYLDHGLEKGRHKPAQGPVLHAQPQPLYRTDQRKGGVVNLVMMFLLYITFIAWEGWCNVLGTPTQTVIEMFGKLVGLSIKLPDPHLRRWRSRLRRWVGANSEPYFKAGLRNRHPLLRSLTLDIHNSQILNKSHLGGPCFSNRRLRRHAKSLRWNVTSVKSKMKADPKAFPLSFFQGLPGIDISIAGVQIWSLIDSGCRFNLITDKKLREIESTTIYPRFKNKVRLAAHNGSDLKLLPSGVYLPVQVNTVAGGQHTVALPFLIEECENKDRLTIIGSQALRDNKLVLDLAEGTLFGGLEDASPPHEFEEGQFHSVIVDNSAPYRDSFPYLPVVTFRVPALTKYSGPLKLESLHCTVCEKFHAPELKCSAPNCNLRMVGNRLLAGDTETGSAKSIPAQVVCSRGTFTLRMNIDFTSAEGAVLKASITLPEKAPTQTNPLGAHNILEASVDAPEFELDAIFHDYTFPYTADIGKITRTCPASWAECMLSYPIYDNSVVAGPGTDANHKCNSAKLNIGTETNCDKAGGVCVLASAPDGTDIYSCARPRGQIFVNSGHDSPATAIGAFVDLAPTGFDTDPLLCKAHNCPLGADADGAIISSASNSGGNLPPDTSTFLSRYSFSKGGGQTPSELVKVEPLDHQSPPDLTILYLSKDQCLLCYSTCTCLSKLKHFSQPKDSYRGFLDLSTYLIVDPVDPSTSPDLVSDLKKH